MKTKLSILALVAATLFVSCGIPFSADIDPFTENIPDLVPADSTEGFGPIALPAEAQQASVTFDTVTLTLAPAVAMNYTIRLYVSDSDISGDATAGDQIGGNIDLSTGVTELNAPEIVNLLNAGATQLYFGLYIVSGDTGGNLSISGAISGTAGLF